MWRRREKILRAYLADLPPLDWFRVENGALCWDDLWVEAGFDGAGTAQYSVNGAIRARGAPRCFAVGGGYQIVALRVRRGGGAALLQGGARAPHRSAHCRRGTIAAYSAA